jgi:hypothetical protein
MFNLKQLYSAYIGSIGAVSASSAINVKVTNQYVTATGYNSASGGWYWCTGTFINRCSFCGGKLSFNPKGTPEGEFTCIRCDADYSINGHCKASGSGVWLTHYTVAKTTVPTSSNIAQVQPVQPKLTLMDLLKIRLNENLLGF